MSDSTPDTARDGRRRPAPQDRRCGDLPATTDADRRRSSASGTGMFGDARHRRHLRVRRPGPARSRCRRRPSARTAAGSTTWPTRSRGARRRRRTGVRRRDREGRGRPGRAHLLRPPRRICSTSPASCATTRPAVRDLPRRQRRALPARDRPRAARRLPPALDHPRRPADPARGRCARTPTRTSPPSSRSTRGNDWHERETWDLFGIVFDGHPALTRILMPDDWPGHPQRKDYPLGGIPVEYKGADIPPPDQRRSYN